MAVEEEEEVDEAGPGVVDRLPLLLPRVVVDVHVLLLASPARTHPWLLLGGAPPAKSVVELSGDEEGRGKRGCGGGEERERRARVGGRGSPACPYMGEAGAGGVATERCSRGGPRRKWRGHWRLRRTEARVREQQEKAKGQWAGPLGGLRGRERKRKGRREGAGLGPVFLYFFWILFSF